MLFYFHQILSFSNQPCVFVYYNLLCSRIANLTHGCVIMEFSPFGQGYGSMAAPTKQFETLVLTKQVEDFGNPVLRWILASTAVMIDPAGNIKPDKAKSSQKIDGIVASIMALEEWMTAQANEDTNPYNNRGLLTL